MSEDPGESEFPSQRVPDDRIAWRQNLEDEIVRIQRNALCVRRAAGVMAVLFLFLVAGLGYPAALLENFFYRAPHLLMHLVYALAVGSLLSLLAFAGLGRVYRKKLNRHKETSRRTIANFFD